MERVMTDTRKELTNRQKEVYDFIIRYIKENGYPPTIREAAENFGIYLKAAHDHVKAIEKKGYIRCQNKSRAIEILDNFMSFKADVVNIPLVGEVAAGLPELATEVNTEDYVPLPVSMVGSDELFALRVKGESMKDAGILPHDIVIVRKQQTALNNDIVVALINDEATVKRFRKEKKKVLLLPENPEFDPIEVNENILILGRVDKVIRNYT